MGVRRRSGGGPVQRAAGPVDLPALVRALPDVVAAERLAAALLCDDLRRLRHVRTVATVALVVSEVLPPDRLETLLSAAVLHDIGYAPLVHSTGFHPLDGAQWLLVRGCPTEVAAAVAHHSEARCQPAAAPFLPRYAALQAPDKPLADVLTYADQTTTPDGRRTGVVRRVVERWHRTGPVDPADREAVLRRIERLVHAVARVDAALAAVGSQDPSLEAADDLLVAARPVADDATVARLLDTSAADAPGRAVAAVQAARLLAASDLDVRWHDDALTAGRLFRGDPAPADAGTAPYPGQAPLSV